MPFLLLHNLSFLLFFFTVSHSGTYHTFTFNKFFYILISNVLLCEFISIFNLHKQQEKIFKHGFIRSFLFMSLFVQKKKTPVTTQTVELTLQNLSRSQLILLLIIIIVAVLKYNILYVDFVLTLLHFLVSLSIVLAYFKLSHIKIKLKSSTVVDTVLVLIFRTLTFATSNLFCSMVLNQDHFTVSAKVFICFGVLTIISIFLTHLDRLFVESAFKIYCAQSTRFNYLTKILLPIFVITFFVFQPYLVNEFTFLACIFSERFVDCSGSGVSKSGTKALDKVSKVISSTFSSSASESSGAPLGSIAGDPVSKGQEGVGIKKSSGLTTEKKFTTSASSLLKHTIGKDATITLADELTLGDKQMSGSNKSTITIAAQKEIIERVLIDSGIKNPDGTYYVDSSSDSSAGSSPQNTSESCDDTDGKTSGSKNNDSNDDSWKTFKESAKFGAGFTAGALAGAVVTGIGKPLTDVVVEKAHEGLSSVNQTINSWGLTNSVDITKTDESTSTEVRFSDDSNVSVKIATTQNPVDPKADTTNLSDKGNSK